MHSKDKIAASFHGQCLVAHLDTGAGDLESGTSGIMSSHGLTGSFSEARVIDVILHLIRVHTFQQSHDAHVSCSDFSAHDCELQVHKFATANATAVNSISGSREFLVTAGRSDFILF